MASVRKFTQITPVSTNEGIVLYALDGNGRAWKLVEGQDHWIGLPFVRQEEEAPKPRWTSTTRRPIEWLAEPPLRPQIAYR
ncbi:MAG: hypothetical protein ACREM3_13505 [Candidatus Rokuibacteriota bacterium]